MTNQPYARSHQHFTHQHFGAKSIHVYGSPSKPFASDSILVSFDIKICALDQTVLTELTFEGTQKQRKL